jgi:hypothetical protein
MRLRRLKKYALGAGGMLVLVMAILLATGWGSAVAAQISSVFVTNDAAHAVPVHANNTDANGNLKVHEQGTANVQGTVNVEQVPVTSGGDFAIIDCSGEGTQEVHQGVATALVIHMQSGVDAMQLRNSGSLILDLEGPGDGALADVNLPLTRPIQFNTIECISSSAANRLIVGWIGNNP